MIFIGEFKELCGKHDYPSIKEYFCDEPYEGKDKIVRYLKTGNIKFASMSLPKDVITGERIKMEKLGMSDGVYAWVNTLAYYVEKYNLRLPKEFEDHILKQSK